MAKKAGRALAPFVFGVCWLIGFKVNGELSFLLPYSGGRGGGFWGARAWLVPPMPHSPLWGVGGARRAAAHPSLASRTGGFRYNTSKVTLGWGRGSLLAAALLGTGRVRGQEHPLGCGAAGASSGVSRHPPCWGRRVRPLRCGNGMMACFQPRWPFWQTWFC